MIKTILITLLIVLSVVFGAQFAVSDNGRDDDEHEGYESEKIGGVFTRTADVATIGNDTYREECGSCHMAYPPGLLPARSWQKLMGSLDNHFGDNAELSPEVTRELSDYLMANSADTSTARRSQQISRSLNANETPLRITDTAFFRREHHELSNRMVRDNPQVKSFSNCNACHQRAEQGSFSEREIRIPGYGRWDD